MSDFAEKADRLLNQEHIKVAYAARAMGRIEAAGKRANSFQRWTAWPEGMQAFFAMSREAPFVTWQAIRDDEQDPLEAAEQEAMEELKDG